MCETVFITTGFIGTAITTAAIVIWPEMLMHKALMSID